MRYSIWRSPVLVIQVDFPEKKEEFENLANPMYTYKIQVTSDKQTKKPLL